MRVEANGVGIEVEVRGEGPPIVLLHGFPDSGRLWRHQVEALVGAGFTTVVPDQRGYGRSDKPADVGAYAIPFLVADVIGVLDHLGIERAHVVGHDWGAAVAWATAIFMPQRVERLVALSVGHPSAFGAPNPEQRERSSYMQLFRQEGVAEDVLTRDDWAMFRAMVGHPDVAAVVGDLERDRSLTPGLNWYRANLPPGSFAEGDGHESAGEGAAPGLELGPVEAPTMGVWSSEDFALTERQMVESAAYVKGAWRYERVEGAGHWLMLDRPDEVNGLLLDFLSG